MSIIIGILSGLITGIGLGGGTLLIIGLTIILGIEQKTAQSINLIFFIPTAVTSIFINSKKKNIRWDIAINIMIFSIIGAIIGAKFATQLKVNILRKMFGIFIGIIAIYEIYSLIKPYIKDKKSNNKIKKNRKEEILDK